jgi:hypothetical protein
VVAKIKPNTNVLGSFCDPGGITLTRFPNFWFNPSIEPKLLAQFSSFLFYPQIKINFACS